MINKLLPFNIDSIWSELFPPNEDPLRMNVPIRSNTVGCVMTSSRNFLRAYQRGLNDHPNIESVN